MVATGMMIVVLRETGWAGVANENSLKPSWGASLGAVRSALGLESEKVAERVTHFGNKSFSVTNFMTNFLECVSLYCFLLCGSGRGGGLGFAGFDFRFRWSSGRPLLCSFRKRGFQEVSYKTSFCVET